MKQLDIEYKNQISAEVPDLWSRIEAGVDAYEASKRNNASEQEKVETEAVKETAKVETIRKAGDGASTIKEDSNIVSIKAARKRKMALVGKVVAAAACLFVVVNVIRMFGGRKNYNTSDNGASVAYNEAPMMEAASDNCAAEAASEPEAYYEEEAGNTNECDAACEDVFEAKEATGEYNYINELGENIAPFNGEPLDRVFATNVVSTVNGVDISGSGYKVSLLYEDGFDTPRQFGIVGGNKSFTATQDKSDVNEYVSEEEELQQLPIAEAELSLTNSVTGFEYDESEEMLNVLKNINTLPVINIEVQDLFADYPNILGEPMSEEFGTYVVTTEDNSVYQIYTYNEERVQVMMILGVKDAKKEDE